MTLIKAVLCGARTKVQLEDGRKETEDSKSVLWVGLPEQAGSVGMKGRCSETEPTVLMFQE